MEIAIQGKGNFMEKRLLYYSLKKRLAVWPGSIMRQFEKHYSGGMSFIQDSEMEKLFIEMCL